MSLCFRQWRAASFCCGGRRTPLASSKGDTSDFELENRTVASLLLPAGSQQWSPLTRRFLWDELSLPIGRQLVIACTSRARKHDAVRTAAREQEGRMYLLTKPAAIDGDHHRRP